MISSDDKAHGGEAFSKNQNPGSVKSAGWNMTEENPFQHKEGIRDFRELYTGKRRQDRSAWANYFVSDGFLEGYQKRDFLELLWDTIKKNQNVHPLNKEFITELMIAYGMKSLEEAEKMAYFRGLEYIYEILKTGPKITRFKESDQVMMEGFLDYQELLMLAMSDWGDEEILRLGYLLDGYQLSNLSDRPSKKVFTLEMSTYEQAQRHPRSLKLITYFFAHKTLPQRVYLSAWNHLWLQNAKVGKEKLFYGPLREVVLAHIPETPRANYKDLLREFYAYDRSSSYYTNAGKTTAEQMRMDYFFSQRSVIDALYDDIFVEEQVLHYWITKNSGWYLIQKLREFYVNHPDAPFSRTVIKKIDLILNDRKVEFDLEIDEQSAFTKGSFDFQKRAYVRYYLNTAFHLAYGKQNHLLLADYLDERMPPSSSWGQNLCLPQGGGWTPDQSIPLMFGGHLLSVRFFPRHIEYRWDQKLTVPSFPGRELLKIYDDDYFWLLLPITAAAPEDYDNLAEEITRRMQSLPVNKEDIPVIADCIASNICRFEEYDVPLFTFYTEKEEQLFRFDIYGNGILKLFEETKTEKFLVSGGTYREADTQAAIAKGLKLLQDLNTDVLAQVQIAVLPDQILVKDRWGTPSALHQKQVTRKNIFILLDQYFEGELKRLELAWTGRSLVFIRDDKQYGCFYFDHRSQDWYALVALPEVYAVVDCKDVVYEPFGLGMLENYLIHRTPRLIQDQLGEIFAQTACENPYPKMMMWSPKIYRFETRQRYRLAKHQFGGFPAEDTENQILDRFYMPRLPMFLFYTDLEEKESPKVMVEKNKAMVQLMLSEYLAGRLKELILAWQYETDKFHYRYLILEKDEDTYQLIYFDDSMKGVDILVANVSEYLDAEEKKYRKETFKGKTVPGYLVHKDVRRIRDYLDYLIPQMQYLAVNLGEFGEFSYHHELSQELIQKLS